MIQGLHLLETRSPQGHYPLQLFRRAHTKKETKNDSFLLLSSPLILPKYGIVRRRIAAGRAGVDSDRIFISATPTFLCLTLLIVAASGLWMGAISRSIMVLYVHGVYPHPWLHQQTPMPKEVRLHQRPNINAINETNAPCEATCWEALVHPSLLAHPNPAIVGIIGGGEGGVLSEVTKHNTVKDVVVVRIDSKEDLHPVPGGERVVDVIIMDAPRDVSGLALNNGRFAELLHDRLSEEGVFAVHLNEQASAFSPQIEALQMAGFESIHVYEEGRNHILVAFKDYRSRANWYRTPAEIDVQIHRRLRRTSGDHNLLIFDASTMVRYQVPSKASETQYCMQEDTPWECAEYNGIDPEVLWVHESHLEARKSTLGPDAGRGLFASHDIPQGTALDLSIGVKAFQFLPSTWSIAEDLYEGGIVKHMISGVHAFVEGYGFRHNLMGKKHFSIEAGVNLFCNHGCNGTRNFGEDDVEHFTEWGVDLDRAPLELMNRVPVAYSPVFERHLRQIMSLGDVTLRDIEQGEEILCDYLLFVGDPDDWKEEVLRQVNV